MAQVALTRRLSDAPIASERLADTVRALDPASRALLDLSIHRGIRDDQMAPILRTDPFHLAWRRARTLERIASELGGADDPAPLPEVRAALGHLPSDVWAARPALMPPPSTELVVARPHALEPLEPDRPRRRGLRARLRRLFRRQAAGA